ncbi:hypothetical protein LY28_00322 [Ruminiclostridium sufflavum DSM 19573]|uniref:Host cell surface-exposed lipoprotein n=1 Tax=Ruminiclostridium sufflavum DSM 19573 TaxID=1121337 RepID=A0A318XTB9_9FIRM|nr:hypothetical protein [Ruminiclostridium sufflavum]PYG89729.1 hypothetical protein LY28_00322 [Ruminiclostridium sufflavum DSM 19573]
MKNKNIIKAGICLAVLLIICTATVFAVSNTQDKSEKAKAEQITADKLNYKVKATTYEEWKEALESLKSKKSTNVITKEKIDELYESGYSLSDIDKAEKLAIASGKTIDEILGLKYSMKGKTLVNTDKSWEEIEAELAVKNNNLLSNQRMSKSTSDTLKSKKFSDKQIVEIEVLSLNYGKDYDQIVKDIESGKNYDQLDKQYWEEQYNKKLNKVESQVINQEDLEKHIKENGKISQDEIQLAEKYGITHITVIGYAKNLSQKYNIRLEEIFKLKKEKTNWSDVISTLEEVK